MVLLFVTKTPPPPRPVHSLAGLEAQTTNTSCHEGLLCLLI